MNVIGILLMVLGAVLLAWAGLIGVDAAPGLRVTNLAGLVAGGTAFIAGATLLGAGKVVEALSEMRVQQLEQHGIPKVRIPDVEEVEVQSDSVNYNTRTGPGIKKTTAYRFRGQFYSTRQEAEAARTSFIAKYGRD